MARIQLDPLGRGLPSSFLPSSSRRFSLPPVLTKRARAIPLIFVVLCLVYFFSGSLLDSPSSAQAAAGMAAAPELKPKGAARFFGWQHDEEPVPEPAGEIDLHGANEEEEIAWRAQLKIDEVQGQLALANALASVEKDAAAAKAQEKEAAHLTAAGKKAQLVSLIAFLSEGGVLSPAIDLSKPLTLADLIAAPRRKSAKFKKIDAGAEQDVQQKYPLVIFSKTFCPYSKKAKSIMAILEPSPPPLVIEVDVRPDGVELKKLLTHLTDRSTFPNVILGFESFGGGDDVELAHAEGSLKGKLRDAGLRVV